MTLEQLIDQLFSFYSQQPGSEIQLVKEDFVERCGPFDEKSSHFELKLAQLSDWYIFGRPFLKAKLQVLEAAKQDLNFYAAAKKDFAIESEPLIEKLNALQSSQHSLFQTLKVKPTQLQIKNLLTAEKLVVDGDFIDSFFPKEQLFEARVVFWDNAQRFAPSFCFHPPEASKFIEKEIKALLKEAKKQKIPFSLEKTEHFIIRLLKMFYKRDQYKHLDVASIYSNQSKLGL